MRADRPPDLPGLVLFAVALLGLVFGTSRMETGIDLVGLASVAVGLAAGCGFVMQELRTHDPALDMRVFRSGRFNAAVTAGVIFNIVLGGSMVLLAFYLVTIRKESHELFGLLLIPATAMAALAATAAGPAANRFGPRTVLVSGLTVMLAGLLVLRSFDLNTSRTVVFVTAALIVVGGALVTTPQATIMMGSAPADLGGAVSAPIRCRKVRDCGRTARSAGMQAQTDRRIWTVCANTRWAPDSGRGIWFVPRWRQSPFLRGGSAQWSKPSTRPPPTRSAQTVMR
jgi:hypothetical protein